ncbi:hypothetical protein F4778DRAFT_787482 [Xylariomycetidae sp. FL2044]|nr:hypothetical protein F4778DRAFT_787482 [Xylariomycetidae sp. FL2044]
MVSNNQTAQDNTEHHTVEIGDREEQGVGGIRVPFTGAPQFETGQVIQRHELSASPIPQHGRGRRSFRSGWSTREPSHAGNEIRAQATAAAVESEPNFTSRQENANNTPDDDPSHVHAPIEPDNPYCFESSPQISSKRSWREWLHMDFKRVSAKQTGLIRAPGGLEKQDEQMVKEFLKLNGVENKRAASWLGTLLIWAPEELEKAQNDLRESRSNVNRLSTDLAKARLSLKKMTDQCNKSKEEAQGLLDKLNHARTEHAQIQDNLKRSHGVEISRRERERSQIEHMAQMREEHWRRVVKQKEEDASREVTRLLTVAVETRQRLEREKQEAVQDMRQQKEKAIEEMNTKMEHTASEFEKVIVSLEQSLSEKNLRIASYSTGNYTPKSDQAFDSSLRSIAQQINNLVAYVPRQQTILDETLDPTHYVARNAKQGNRTWPRFVRNVCWNILLEGFFHHQLGFGAFGAQNEASSLLALFSPTEENKTSSGLPNTKEFNVWRATLFETLLKGMTSATTAASKYSSMFEENVKRVTCKLAKALQQICNGGLDPGCHAQLSSITQESGMLALEMGSQRVLLLLESCAHGDHVTSNRFADESDCGVTEFKVDLMTLPCLRRVGDGRQELGMEKVIVRGSVVALKPSH